MDNELGCSFLLYLILYIALSIFGLTFGAAITFWWGQTMYNWIFGG